MHLDQFYTNPTVASSYIDLLKSDYGLDGFFCLEPSAGTGAFFDLLPSNKLGLDLDPKCEGIVEGDFLLFDVSAHENINCDDLPIASVGNPPFGKNSSLAVRFFNKCSEFSTMIAMILPRTFLKASIINRLNEDFVLKHSELVPDMSFIADGRPYDVPCVFQIWVKSSTPRPKITTAFSHTDFEFTTAEKAEFAVQRVGVNAGRIKTNVMELSSQSHLFIRSINPSAMQNFQLLDFSTVKYNTAGNPSVSKAEIVSLYSSLVAQAIISDGQ